MSGYLNNSPLGAFTLAIITQITFNIIRIPIKGNPIIMKHNGLTSTIYKRIESWKFREFLPFIFTHEDSSFLVSQQIRGPIIPPKGKKKPANADRWHNIDQFLSVSDNTLFSSITIKYLLKRRICFRNAASILFCNPFQIGR
jgi:hypothetical protein